MTTHIENLAQVSNSFLGTQGWLWYSRHVLEGLLPYLLVTRASVPTGLGVPCCHCLLGTLSSRPRGKLAPRDSVAQTIFRDCILFVSTLTSCFQCCVIFVRTDLHELWFPSLYILVFLFYLGIALPLRGRNGASIFQHLLYARNCTRYSHMESY